jgi:hypothetical protein
MKILKKRNFYYGFPSFTGHVFIDLVLSGLQANMRLGLTSQSLCTDQIGPEYVIIICNVDDAHSACDRFFAVITLA